jgi:hypothetical protein
MTAVAKKLWVLGGVLPALALSGCISFKGHFGTKIRVENIPRLETGVTTREQIMGGAAVLNDVYTYRYIENKTTVLFVPIFVAFLDTVAVAETLTIFFDENGRVEYHAYRQDVPRPEKDD